MNLFAVAAGLMAVIHLIAGVQRPRPAVIASGVLWLLYAFYEYLMASGVLCGADCNIRADLAFILPILALATFCAYRSYVGRTGGLKVAGIVLGMIGLFFLGVMAESRGYGDLAGVAFLGALAAIVVYAIRSRLKTKRP